MSELRNSRVSRRLSLVRLLPAALLLLALGLGFPIPSRACTAPPHVADIWIRIVDGHVWIIIRGFHTLRASPGSVCGCGMKLVPSLAAVESAEVIDSATQQPMPGFSPFDPDPATTGSLPAGFEGLKSAVSQTIPDNLTVELVFHGLLSSGATFDSLARELRQASNPVGAGETNPTGAFDSAHPSHFIEDIRRTDPTTSSAGAPVIRVVRANAEVSGRVELALQDAAVGLSLITTSGAGNATARVATFSPGTREPVAVTVALPDERSPGTVEVKACNVLGRCSTSKLALMALELGDQPALQQAMRISSAQSRFFFQNGDPGVRMLALAVDGRKLSVRPLADGQILEGDLAAALGSGLNVLTCSARGAVHARGLLVLSSAP